MPEDMYAQGFLSLIAGECFVFCIQFLTMFVITHRWGMLCILFLVFDNVCYHSLLRNSRKLGWTGPSPGVVVAPDF